MKICDDNGNEIDDMIEISARYHTAFFKVHLDEDGRYQPFLTPGIANQDERVTVKVTGGAGAQ